MELINVKDLRYAYASNGQDVLKGINLQLNSGTMYLLAGQSGCGKSTLLKQLKPSITPAGYRKGQILFQGQDIESLSHVDDASMIGYVGQNPNSQIVTDTVRAELAFGPESLGIEPLVIRQRIAEVAIFFGLDKMLDRKCQDLSGGEKQLLNLASAMIMNPKLLILDEPTAQLDPMSARKFLDMIIRINSELGTCILICEHHLQDIYPIVDTVFLMEDGCIVKQASPRDYISNEYIEAGLPAAFRIASTLQHTNSLPLTVSEGIRFVDEYISDIGRGEDLFWKKENSCEEDISSRDYAVQLRGISFRYSRADRDILSGANLDIESNKITSIVGGNGAGKTTLVKIMSGLLSPYEGRIYIDGARCKKQSDFPRGAGGIVYLPQDPRSLITGISVRDELEDSMIARMGLEGLEDMHPYDLSGGQIQRLALGKLLAVSPRILILDEPSKGLDPKCKEELVNKLRGLARQMTIIIVSHDLDFVADVSDDVVMCFDGLVSQRKSSHEFFAENNLYTTSANRIIKKHNPYAITCREVVDFLGGVS